MASSAWWRGGWPPAPGTRRRLTLCLALGFASCVRHEGRETSGAVVEIHRQHRSDILAPAHWVVRSPADWSDTRQRIDPAGGRIGAEVAPDFARETLVVAAAGIGSSDTPLVRLGGFRDANGFREVVVRYETGCDAANDVTSVVVIGSMPRYDGEIRILARRIAARGC